MKIFIKHKGKDGKNSGCTGLQPSADILNKPVHQILSVQNGKVKIKCRYKQELLYRF